MNVRLYNHEDQGAWEAYVEDAGDSNLYHLIGWKDVIEKTFGHKTYYLLAEDNDGKITGILPLVHLRSLLFGSFIVSMPYFNYGGISAKDAKARMALLEEAIKITRATGASHAELRHDAALDLGLKVKTAKVSMLLDLPPLAQSLLKGFPSKLRSQIKKAESGITRFNSGGIDELDSFYDVFSTNMRELGTPVYSKAFFRNILERFPKRAHICTVYVGSAPAASGFLIGFRDTLEIPWASSIRAFNGLSPNMALYWNCLRLAIEKGFSRFDFGRSTPGEGTYRFKEQWGAKPRPLYWHYWMKDGGRMPLPELNPKNPKYRAMINIWKRLPLGLTRLIGPGIVKNLP
ncbi:MAG: FemAB family PEP-CTERM system-associated protein [Deltaproteobacteria bacterium]|nr:FemAB family PEP-CTERM system-associated protein [Deltaproteobacteria bacterium]